jgi:2,4-dienoyl-CoA reductase-like NADH-dependent reductase (Old Yellow Enzyme family)
VNATDPIFQPLQLGPVTIKNRVLRSSIAGLYANYDGSGTPLNVAWESRFARGGVGAVISPNAPIHPSGRIAPGYAHIDDDARVPFWREVGRRVRDHDCKYILQIVHAGREQIVRGIEFDISLGASDRAEPMNGIACRRLSVDQIQQLIRGFAAAARRAREAEVDGIELAGANGMIFTQFLSPAINDREDDYGGSLENRARFSLDVVRAIRAEVGRDFCVGFKISVRENLNELAPWLQRGNEPADVVRVCQWLEEAGADYLHVSAGAGFPHPRNPAGDFPPSEVVKTYDRLLSSGRYTFRNYLVFRTWPLSAAFRWWWRRPGRQRGVEGINLPDSHAVKRAVGIPVLCTGGFQTASVIRAAITRGDCDGVTIARSLLANPNLVQLFAAGHDRAERPCTYSNRCLFTFLENPLACYDETRFDSREEMMAEALSIFEEAELPADVAW